MKLLLPERRNHLESLYKAMAAMDIAIIFAKVTIMNVNFYWNDEYKEGIKYLPLHWTASVVEYFSRTGFQWLVLTSAFYRCLLVTRPAHARSWFSRLCVIFSVAWIVEFLCL